MSILLMTGTICPNVGARELARIDVNARIIDYRRALIHNLALLRDDKISSLIFVENSGYGMNDFSDLVSDRKIADRVEMMSYNAAQPPGQTRFAGECSLLHHTLRHSRLIGQQSGGHIWKITGRYTVQNLAGILKGSEGNNDLIVHCRDYPMRFVDFGLVGFSTHRALDILERILGTSGIDDMDERMIRDLIDQGHFSDLTVRTRFNRIPDFRGVRGSDNASYGGLKYRAQYVTRCIVHWTAPRVWI